MHARVHQGLNLNGDLGLLRLMRLCINNVFIAISMIGATRRCLMGEGEPGDERGGRKTDMVRTTDEGASEIRETMLMLITMMDMVAGLVGMKRVGNKYSAKSAKCSARQK